MKRKMYLTFVYRFSRPPLFLTLTYKERKKKKKKEKEQKNDNLTTVSLSKRLSLENSLKLEIL